MLGSKWSLKSVNHRFFWGQSIVQVLLVILAAANVGMAVLLAFALVALIFVGIPHGGNDYFYRPDKTGWGSIRFLLYYLGSMALYAGLWYALPLAALVIFLGISMHHFGQSNFLSSRWTDPESLLWGGWLLVFPILLHLPEAMGIFGRMVGYCGAGDWLGATVDQSVMVVVTGAFFGLYAWVLWRRKVEHRGQYLLQWGVVTLWYMVSPLILGFIVVFCLWHAGQSMRYQVIYILQRHNKSLARVLLEFMPLGFLALLGWVILWIGKTEDWALLLNSASISEAMPMGFVLLSLVTLPHVVVMDGIYRTESHR